VSLPVWNPTARNFIELADRWGTPSGRNINSLLSGVIPVTVVERFRDDLQGSLYGITAETDGDFNEFSACLFTSLTRAWEIHSVNVSWPRVSGVAPVQQTYLEGLHVFNPISPYNPVINNTAGFFRPGLINNREFNFGTVLGISGTNGFPPIFLGATLCDNMVRVTPNFANETFRGDAQEYTYESATGLQKQMTGAALGIKLKGDDRKCQNVIKFDPPLRIQPNGTICFQLKHVVAGERFFLQVSIIYTEIETIR